MIITSPHRMRLFNTFMLAPCLHVVFGYAPIIARVSYIVNTFFAFCGIFCAFTGVKSVVKITTIMVLQWLFACIFRGFIVQLIFLDKKDRKFGIDYFFCVQTKNISLAIFRCLKCLKSLKRQKKKREKKTFNAFYTRDRTPAEEKVEPE